MTTDRPRVIRCSTVSTVAVYGVLMVMLSLVGCQGFGERLDSAAAATGELPEVPREFRAAWVATVANIDWPSKPGLSTSQQQEELLAILDKAVELNLNAIVLQVRPAGDALYESELEPWSTYLTGEQGKAPDPYWDPLAFAVEHAHARGLELHAWFNPYRAGHPSAASAMADSHLSKRRPDLVRQYGNMLWMDPSEPDVQDHTMAVILDMIRRYDVDGVHLDDYFYPYPQRDDAGATIDFPDQANWQAYQARGGRLSRSDWRRSHIDSFMRRLYREVKREKRHVKVGISPFGIWKPGHPPSVRGMNQYETIYADARKWLVEGWCDYFTPQLYWPIRAPEQSFISLLQWWLEQNAKDRHVWPGLYTSRTEDGSARAFDDQEIRYQVEWTRILIPESPGHVHFSVKPLLANKAELSETLKKSVYQQQALPPQTPWLGRAPGFRGAAPRGEVTVADGGALVVELQERTLAGTHVWVAQVKREGRWSHEIVPAATRVLELDGAGVESIRVFSVDRNGNASRATDLKLPS